MDSINQVLLDEIDKLIKRRQDMLSAYREQTILVTGATGLLGRTLIQVLLRSNEKLGLNISIVAVARNKKRVEKFFGKLMELEALTFVYQDISQPFAEFGRKINFIFHTAAVTTSRFLVERPVEAYVAQFYGMLNVLNFARQNDAKVVYLSSMEIYGQPFVDGRASEDDLGYVNPLVVRNGYPESKRSNEFLASAYYHEYGVKVVNARLAQTFGPGVLQDDTRVFAQFARSAINNESLVLHSDGTSVGNYAYIIDTLDALLLLALEGSEGESYNIVNEANSVTIKELAEIVAKQFGNGEVVIDIPETDMGYAPKTQLRLSGSKLEALGWHPTADLTEMFSKMIESWEA